MSARKTNNQRIVIIKPRRATTSGVLMGCWSYSQSSALASKVSVTGILGDFRYTPWYDEHAARAERVRTARVHRNSRSRCRQRSDRRAGRVPRFPSAPEDPSSSLLASTSHSCRTLFRLCIAAGHFQVY
jgi:hypothetical protein